MTLRDKGPAVEVDEEDVPLMTLSGVLWHWPPYAGSLRLGRGWMRSCHPLRCKFFYECKAAVAKGNYIACEAPLEEEIIKED